MNLEKKWGFGVNGSLDNKKLEIVPPISKPFVLQDNVQLQDTFDKDPKPCTKKEQAFFKLIQCKVEIT